MNKVLFNGGGQPIYLDDLQIIQDGVREAAEEIISALGVDLDQEVFFVKKPTMTLNGSLATFSDGVLWHEDYGLIPINRVSNLNIGSAQAYVKIVVTDSDSRTFEDGQQYACKRTVVANIVNSQSGTCYPFSGIDDMVSRLSALLDKSNSEHWIPINVHFYNDYSGTVEYQEFEDFYRIRIDISSTDYENQQGSIALFGTWDSRWPGRYRDQRSGLFGAGGDDVSYTSYISFGQDGDAVLDRFGSGDCWSPGECSVKTIFDIPK